MSYHELWSLVGQLTHARGGPWQMQQGSRSARSSRGLFWWCGSWPGGQGPRTWWRENPWLKTAPAGGLEVGQVWLEDREWHPWWLDWDSPFVFHPVSGWKDLRTPCNFQCHFHLFSSFALPFHFPFLNMIQWHEKHLDLAFQDRSVRTKEHIREEEKVLDQRVQRVLISYWRSAYYLTFGFWTREDR